MIDVILNFFNDDFNTSKKSIESKFNRIPNIGENLDYVSSRDEQYYGKVVGIETYKNDLRDECRIYINVELFKTC